MLRRRVPDLSLSDVGPVPLDLLDAGSLVWRSEGTTRRWLKLHDLPVDDPRVKVGPVNRWRCACEGWAHVAGLVGKPSRNGHVPVDWARLRELGVNGFSWGDALEEWFKFEGVVVES